MRAYRLFDHQFDQINLFQSVPQYLDSVSSPYFGLKLTYSVWIQEFHILLTRYPNAHEHSTNFALPHPRDIYMTRKFFGEHRDSLDGSSVFPVSHPPGLDLGKTYGLLS
jgi:hypothetical protein